MGAQKDQVERISTKEIISKVYKHLATRIFIFVLFITVKEEWKTHTHSRIGKWFKNAYYGHI